MEALHYAALAFGAAAGTLAGLASVIREVSLHKVAMRLIDMGKAPPPRPRNRLTSLLTKLRDKG